MCQCEVLGPKCWCVLGQGRLWWPLSRGLAAGKGALLPGSTEIVPCPCSALNAAASPCWYGLSSVWEEAICGVRTIFFGV